VFSRIMEVESFEDEEQSFAGQVIRDTKNSDNAIVGDEQRNH
jgi:hypothetical protein